MVFDRIFGQAAVQTFLFFQGILYSASFGVEYVRM